MSRLQEWIEAALIVADGEDMPDSEVIPTWPADVASHYPALTVGAMREWQAARAQGGRGAEPVGIDWREQNAERVARAFWRRIYPYRNDYGKELPEECPVEFSANMATALSAIASTQPAQQGRVPRWKELEALADEYVEGYEFRGDEGDYHPTERERFLIEDCVAGLMDEIHQMLKRTTPQPEGDGWVKCSERLPEPRYSGRKTPNGILVMFDTGRIAQIHDVTETLVWRMKNGPRQPKKFEVSAPPAIVAWLDLDEISTGLKRPQPPAQEGEGDEH